MKGFIVSLLLFITLVLYPERAIQAQQNKWLTVYYPVWCMVPLDFSSGYGLPPWEIKWTGITGVVHFFNKNNIDTTTSPYFTPVTNPNDSIEYEFYGLGNPGAGPGTWIPWQDSLITIAHRNGAHVFLNVQSVDAKYLNWIAADSIRTDTFVDATVGYGERKGYDGVELNWEAWITPLAPKDQISRLIRRFRVRLDASPSCSLLAIAPGQADWNRYDPSATDMIDEINIQMYGYVTAWYGAILQNAAWYLSPLHTGTIPAQFDGMSWDTQGPLQWVSAGHDASRIGVGIPSFGWVMKDVDSLFQGIDHSCNYGYGKYQDCIALLSNGGTESWDDERKVPYISGTAISNQGATFCGAPGVSMGQKFFATYENQQSISEKIAWINVNNFGGVMYYDLSTDLQSSMPFGQRNPVLNFVVNSLVSVERVSASVPKKFLLGQNFPNPFNPSTIIPFSVPKRSHVSLTIYNSIGQVVAELVNRTMDPGEYRVTFDTSRKARMSTGAYFYRLETPEFSESKKFVFAK